VAGQLQHGAVDLAHLAHGIAHHQHIGHGGQHAFGEVMGLGQFAVLGFQCFLRGHQFAIHLVHALDDIYPGGFGQLLAGCGNAVVRQADWRIQGMVVGMTAVSCNGQWVSSGGRSGRRSARPALRPGRPAVLILCRSVLTGSFLLFSLVIAAAAAVRWYRVGVSFFSTAWQRCQAVCLRVVANNDNSNRVITCKKCNQMQSR
jgi:hypothetical protein